MNRNPRDYIYVLLAIVIAGCATVNHQFDPAAIDRLEPGVATVADAVDALGPYSAEAHHPNGNSAYSWMYARANTFTGRSSTQSATLVFGPDGRLLSHSSGSTEVR